MTATDDLLSNQPINKSTNHQIVANWRARILIGAGIVVVLVGAVVAVMVWRLDGFVQREIERRGAEMTGTEVAVDSLHVSLTDGTATLSGLTVDNPPGFSAPFAFELGQIGVQLALGSVLSDPIVIDEIRIEAPHVTCELDASGKSNIEMLRRAVEHAEKQSKPRGERHEPRPAGVHAPSSARKLIIKRVTVHDGEVYVDARAAGGPERRETLPGFDLTDIGVAQGGATPTEVGRIVVTALARDVAVAVAATELERFIGKDLGGPAGDFLKKGGAEAIRKGLGGILDQLLRKKEPPPP